MAQAPLTFEGDLDALFENHIQPNLPYPDSRPPLSRVVEGRPCLGPDPLFLIRKVSQTDRRNIYVNDGGNRFRATDNSPAWWMTLTSRSTT